jgi:hypothetical protein
LKAIRGCLKWGVRSLSNLVIEHGLPLTWKTLVKDKSMFWFRTRNYQNSINPRLLCMKRISISTRLRTPSRKCLPKQPTIIWKKKILVVAEKKKASITRFLPWLGYVKAISDMKFPVSTVLLDCLQHSLPTRVPTRLQAALVNFYRFPHVLIMHH